VAAPSAPALHVSAAAPAIEVPAPFPLPVIELSGTPDQLAAGYARQLGKPMYELFRKYLVPSFHSALERYVALAAAKVFEGHMLPAHRAEVAALARDTSLDERAVALAQCFLDLQPSTACSTLTLPAEAAPDGIARFGRNLDFPSRGIADKRTVILIYRPAGRYAFAAVSWPGLVGVLSGMNEHGLALANMEVPRAPRLPTAMPYTLLYRMVLERCRTVDEVIALLKATPRQTANNLMLMDATGARAVAEITPQGVVVRRGRPGAALLSTNHQRGQDTATTGLCWRYDRLKAESAAHFGDIGVKRIERMLADTAQGDLTLQSMVFEPATRRLYLATGKDAPEHPFYPLDLKPLFHPPS
jgi:hypothetical protein